MFETAAKAEQALLDQGFKPVADSYDWIDAEGHKMAIVHPVYEAASGVWRYRIQHRRAVVSI